MCDTGPVEQKVFGGIKSLIIQEVHIVKAKGVIKISSLIIQCRSRGISTNLMNRAAGIVEETAAGNNIATSKSN